MTSPSDDLLEAAVVFSRLLQFAAAAVLVGSALFFLYGARPAPATPWPARLLAVAAATGAVGTLAWFAAQAAQLADTPRAALDPAFAWSVAAGTSFGRAAALRFIAFLTAAVAAAFLRSRGSGYLATLAGFGAAASASFGWTGHGARDEGLAGLIHLSADVLHILAASVWIGALAGLSMLIWRAHRRADPGFAQDALTGLLRFSAIGVAVVAVLVGSGLVNSWYLIGLAGIERMPTTPYGRLLLAKLALFVLMLALAAANRWRRTPQLKLALQAGASGSVVVRPVMISVLTETALAIAVLALVSWLGTLTPPVEVLAG